MRRDERLCLRRDGCKDAFLIEPGTIDAASILRGIEPGASNLTCQYLLILPPSDIPFVSGNSDRQWPYADAGPLADTRLEAVVHRAPVDGRRPAAEAVGRDHEAAVHVAALHWEGQGSTHAMDAGTGAQREAEGGTRLGGTAEGTTQAGRTLGDRMVEDTRQFNNLLSNSRVVAYWIL